MRWLDDEFPPTTTDAVWLAEVGRREWMVVTRDKKIRTRPAERAAIVAASVGCFVLDQKKDPTRWEYLKLLAGRLDDMEILFKNTPTPFLYAVSASGQLRLLP